MKSSARTTSGDGDVANGHLSLDDWMALRADLTSVSLPAEPRNFKHHLRRAVVHQELGYPDLAVGDAYRALTLLEGYFDPDCSEFEPERWDEAVGELVQWPRDEPTVLDANRDMIECLKTLVQALALLGCARDAYTYLLQLGKLDQAGSRHSAEIYQKLLDLVLQSPSVLSKEPFENDRGLSYPSVEPSRLPNFGLARREVYKWNKYEPARSSPQCLQDLNNLLKGVTDDLEVRTAQLPVLTGSGAQCSTAKSSSDLDQTANSLQLGLFAKIELRPSAIVLREASSLTAVRPLYASICDNCASHISELASSTITADDASTPICCPSCGDAAIFCCQACWEAAQTGYHSTTCGNEDIELLGRDDDSEYPSEDLYFRLLVRAVAMSHSQDMHPLELPEVKYLWGEFTTTQRPAPKHGEGGYDRSLPFTFQHNIVLPFRLLSALCEEHPEMSPFSARGINWYDSWVVETLYAKFRGVASARQSTWDGRPEVAAVHPLWCLANHSCAPNVGWSWGKERMFTVRDKSIIWGEHRDLESASAQAPSAIQAGEEILSHYCDLDLPVGERREYMIGSLGGPCRCDRCVWEANPAHSMPGSGAGTNQRRATDMATDP